jgi:hypothetical protein
LKILLILVNFSLRKEFVVMKEMPPHPAIIEGKGYPPSAVPERTVGWGEGSLSKN